MSRSQPILENPATRWFEWKGSEGGIRYYDKEKQENINVPLPFPFLVLDVLSTIKGWHDQSESGIYSNEVHRIDREPLRVRSFEGNLMIEGLYRNIKNDIKAAGGRFVSSIYIAYWNDLDELKIGNLSLKGAALSSWMDFKRKIGRGRLYDEVIIIDGFEEGQKGSITYHTPTFQTREAPSNVDQKAVEFDKQLQEYLETKQDEFEEPVETQSKSSEQPTGKQDGKQLYGDENNGQSNQPVSSEVDLNENFDDIDDDLPF